MKFYSLMHCVKAREELSELFVARFNFIFRLPYRYTCRSTTGRPYTSTTRNETIIEQLNTYIHNMPTTTRVDIDGQFITTITNRGCRISLCPSTTEVKINRTYPATLSGHMSPGEWTRFCEDFDRELLKEGGVQEANKTLILSSRISFLPVVLLGFIYVAASALGWGTDFLIVIVIPCIIVPGLLYIMAKRSFM